MAISSRQRAFFLIALWRHPKNVEALLSFVSAEERAPLIKLYENLKNNRESDIRAAALSELKGLSRNKPFNYLAEVHDDWIAEILKKEPPRLIATVLRYLPAQRIQNVLDRFPPAVLASLPKLIETCSLDPRLVELLQNRFESLFEIDREFDGAGAFAFEHFPLLRSVQIRRIFMEMGYREIALGLSSLPEVTRIMVLNRLAANDRKHVEYYFAKVPEVSAQRVKKAQAHVISKDVDPRFPELFVRELGFLVFAKGLLLRDEADLVYIERKLPMLEARALRSIMSQHVPLNTEASVLPYREDLMSSARRVLNERGLRES